jgi:hypothetical protein
MESEKTGVGRIVAACVVGGLLAGAFDITYACTVWAMRGIEPMRIFQSVASGLFGPASFDGGIETAVLGGVLHFAMAYGGAIFLVMNFIVVPLSRARWRLPPIEAYLTEFAVHIFLVGVTIALIARLFLGKR